LTTGIVNFIVTAMPVLESYRGQGFIGVEELATVASSLVELYSPEPQRGNVRLTITPRTVRHYLGEDLLGEPTGHAGTSIVFNYGNLLRLLAVKKMLADHWSVIKIKEFMMALDITALEQLVNGAFTSNKSTRSTHQTQKPDARREMDRAIDARFAQRRQSEAAAAATHKHAPPRPTSFLAPTAPPPPLASLAVESARRLARKPDEWIEIAPGLEIKIRRGFRPPQNAEERERLSSRFWSVIKSKGSSDEG
jgi:hypothetical protein